MPLTVPMRRGAVVLALAAGTNIHPRPQCSKPSKAETKCCAFRGYFHAQRQQDKLPLEKPTHEVSLRSTKQLPSALDSSTVLCLGQSSTSCLLSGLHFLPVGTAQGYHQHRYSRAGLSKQESWLPATSVLQVGFSSQSKGRSTHFAAHL